MGHRGFCLPDDRLRRCLRLSQPHAAPDSVHPEGFGGRRHLRRRRRATRESDANPREPPESPPRRGVPQRRRTTGDELQGAGAIRRVGGSEIPSLSRRRHGDPPGRIGNTHLHIRHHRRAQRRDAHTRKPDEQRAGSHGGPPGWRNRRVPVGSSAVARVRTHGRLLRDGGGGRDDRVRRELQHHWTQPQRNPADGDAGGATPLREDVRPHSRASAVGWSGEETHLLVGAPNRGEVGRSQTRETSGARGPGTAVSHRIPPRVLQTHRADRWAFAIFRVRRSTAVAGNRQVLLRSGTPRLGGLRTH